VKKIRRYIIKSAKLDKGINGIVFEVPNDLSHDTNKEFQLSMFATQYVDFVVEEITEEENKP